MSRLPQNCLYAKIGATGGIPHDNLNKCGRILDPATKTDDVMDLFIEDGVITKRGKNNQEKGREDYRWPKDCM